MTETNPIHLKKKFLNSPSRSFVIDVSIIKIAGVPIKQIKWQKSISLSHSTSHDPVHWANPGCVPSAVSGRNCFLSVTPPAKSAACHDKKRATFYSSSWCLTSQGEHTPLSLGVFWHGSLGKKVIPTWNCCEGLSAVNRSQLPKRDMVSHVLLKIVTRSCARNKRFLFHIYNCKILKGRKQRMVLNERSLEANWMLAYLSLAAGGCLCLVVYFDRQNSVTNNLFFQFNSAGVKRQTLVYFTPS